MSSTNEQEYHRQQQKQRCALWPIAAIKNTSQCHYGLRFGRPIKVSDHIAGWIWQWTYQIAKRQPPRIRRWPKVTRAGTFSTSEGVNHAAKLRRYKKGLPISTRAPVLRQVPSPVTTANASSSQNALRHMRFNSRKMVRMSAARWETMSTIRPTSTMLAYAVCEG